jgi:hypothetical protein
MRTEETFLSYERLLLRCTTANNPSNTSTPVINATTKNYAHVGGIVARTRSGSTRATGAITQALTGSPAGLCSA